MEKIIAPKIVHLSKGGLGIDQPNSGYGAQLPIIAQLPNISMASNPQFSI